MDTEYFNEASTQTEACPHWQEGRERDMAAFDQLPGTIRSFLNEHNCVFPVEDVLYEYRSKFLGSISRTLEWIKQSNEELQVTLF